MSNAGGRSPGLYVADYTFWPDATGPLGLLLVVRVPGGERSTQPVSGRWLRSMVAARALPTEPTEIPADQALPVSRRGWPVDWGPGDVGLLDDVARQITESLAQSSGPGLDPQEVAYSSDLAWELAWGDARLAVTDAELEEVWQPALVKPTWRIPDPADDRNDVVVGHLFFPEVDEDEGPLGLLSCERVPAGEHVTRLVRGSWLFRTTLSRTLPLEGLSVADLPADVALPVYRDGWPGEWEIEYWDPFLDHIVRRLDEAATRGRTLLMSRKETADYAWTAVRDWVATENIEITWRQDEN